jgi:hypothetical protein
MYFEFYLDDLEIEEPQGFADIVLNMKRDDNWHGIFFEASTSELAFYGAAAAYLKDKKQTQGLKSDVTFKALQSCGIYEDLEIIFEGKLDFGKYTESCGNTCLVKIPVEQTGCLMTLRNRYDQKVNLDKETTSNNISLLSNYDQLGKTLTLPPKALKVSVNGYVADDGYTFTLLAGDAGIDHTIIRPTYSNKIDESILTGALDPVFNYTSTINSEAGINMTPQLLFEDEITCFNGNFDYSFRFKGDFTLFKPNGNLFRTVSVKLKIVKWDGTGDIFNNSTIVDQFDTGLSSGGFVNSFSGSFDHSFSGTTVIADGEGFYGYIDFETDQGLIGADIDWTVNFDSDTYCNIEAVKVCPATETEYYMLNETLSRLSESITDNCLKVKSDYYGRTDSQPYSSDEDGCGSLRIVTSGLKIRNAPSPAFFVSLKDLFDGLKGIDNIGMGIEDNPNISGNKWLRIETVDYFYQDVEILALPFVPQADVSIQEQLHYSLIKSGYQKWEVESVNGLDEPNSNREYRTGLSSVNNPIDITSKLIAGSYPIELTRQQSFAETGAADTTYDNETFIICVERQAYNFIVEQGNVDNAANVFSPETLYNWRIRPFSNLMRWFKSIANSYPNIVDSENKLFFSAGTGNYLAEGELSGPYPTCRLENGVKAENRDLSKYDFSDVSEATPLWKPEYATLKYPLSIAEYKALKANPYGYISFQCGTGEWRKGYIQDTRYRLNKGEADFALKLKW